MMDELTRSLADRLLRERQARGWSIGELASEADVSSAMISKIERGEANPTAVLLSKLAAAFGLSLSSLLSDIEGSARPLARRAEQPEWRDPQTGYLRRTLSPRTDGPLELIEVIFPPGARIDYPRSVYRFIRQQVWILEGALHVVQADALHELQAGDCFDFGAPADSSFYNPGAAPCRYLVALVGR